MEKSFHQVSVGGFAGDVLRLLATEEIPLGQQQAREWRNLLYPEYVQKTIFPVISDLQPDVIYERYSVLSYAGAELAQQLRVPLLLEVNAPLSLEKARYRGLILKQSFRGRTGRIYYGTSMT